jgi:YhcH/YjgK/YiaL family protein
MIIDKLKNVGLYDGMGSKLKLAFEFLKKNDFVNMAAGKYEIDGCDVYAMVQQYEPKPLEQGAWEAHRKYIDVQYMVSGNETMGYSCIEGMKTKIEYDESRDCIFFEGEGDYFKVGEGFFVIFAPQDAHMPSIEYKKPETVKKVVVKVAVD